jgi:hypothetical protein
MSTSFSRGESPLRAEKLNQAFSERVNRLGDTMYGILTLARDPIGLLDAATKRYVDSRAGSGGGGNGGTYLPLSGGTMSGSLFLYADPINPLEATTKQYVDNHVIDGGNF